MSLQFRKLTRLAARALKSGTITEHGITFERLQNGDGVYSINIMVDGQRIHRTIGRQSENTTRTQAEEFIARVRNDAKCDRLVLPKGRKVALSFEKAAIEYLKELQIEGGKDIRMKQIR